MEKTQEENNKIYIQNSKSNINDYIQKNNYRKAFMLLILVLERLNENEKIEFIDYYSKNLNELIMGISNLDDITFSA